MSEKIYTYVENGAGIAGLPQRISESELAAMPEGVQAVFRSALERGAYKSEGDPTPAPPQIQEQDLERENRPRKFKSFKASNDAEPGE